MDEEKGVDFPTILANSVHDMKNSVAMLLGALDDIDLLPEAGSPELRQALSRLRYEGRRLNGNLVQMLVLYRIGAGQYAPDLAEHDVEEVLEECVLENQGLLAAKGIEIEMDAEPGLDWFFDRTLVASVLNSMVNNAYKYTRDRIRLSAERTDEGFLCLAVAENGGGYPPALLCSDPAAPCGIDAAQGRTGLGLYFAATIAELHRHRGRSGYVTTSNDGIDGGGCFRLFLP